MEDIYNEKVATKTPERQPILLQSNQVPERNALSSHITPKFVEPKSVETNKLYAEDVKDTNENEEVELNDNAANFHSITSNGDAVTSPNNVDATGN